MASVTDVFCNIWHVLAICFKSQSKDTSVTAAVTSVFCNNRRLFAKCFKSQPKSTPVTATVTDVFCNTWRSPSPSVSKVCRKYIRDGSRDECILKHLACPRQVFQKSTEKYSRDECLLQQSAPTFANCFEIHSKSTPVTASVTDVFCNTWHPPSPSVSKVCRKIHP